MQVLSQCVYSGDGGSGMVRSFLHPSKRCILLCVVGDGAAAEALPQYVQDQFDAAVITSALDFHQVLEHCVTTAQRLGATLSLIGVGVIGEESVLAAYHGTLLLQRGEKIAPLIQSHQTLDLRQGVLRAGDRFVLLTPAAQELQSVIISQLKEVKEVPDDFFTTTDFQAAVQRLPQTRTVGVAVVSAHDAAEHRLTAAHVDHTQTTPTQGPSQFERIMSIAHGLAEALWKQVRQLQSSDLATQRRLRKRAGKAALMVMMVLVAGGGMIFGVRTWQAQRQRQIDEVIRPFQQRLVQIQQFSDQDPIEARVQTETLIGELAIRSRLVDQPAHVQQALQKQLTQTQDFAQSISGRKELPGLPTFFDLRLVQANFLAGAVDATKDTLFFLDSDQRKVLAVNIEKKQSQLLPIGEHSEMRAMRTDDRYLYFLGQGIFRFSLGSADTATLVQPTDETIQSGQSLGLFGSSVYVLNQSRNNIFRYPLGEQVSTPSAWVQSSQAVEFQRVASFAIDGDIWMGTTDGRLRKFTSGREVEFAVQGLADPFTSALKVFTKPDMENIYVLETTSNRVVIIKKDGTFLKEFRSDVLGVATGVVASEERKKAFVLSGSLVYELDLSL